MLDNPLTVGNLIVINGVTVLPILVFLARGVWYLSRMVHQHDQMWTWFDGTRDRRSKERRVPPRSDGDV